jgi:hypothetical protein
MSTSNFPLGLLFGRPAVDADGQSIGRVHDIRLRRDGPIIPGFGPALRVEGLILGRGSIAKRLGLDRKDITGPWPLDAWGKRAARHAKFIPWESVAIEGDHIKCAQRLAEMRSAYP